jgi:low affinity Fe/Cu permease
MADQKGPTRLADRLDAVGCRVSETVAEFFASPIAQVGVVLICAAWFLFGFEIDVLTAALSILAITLTQMVLNKQEAREKDAHRRDVALHAKLDELLHASKRARDELAGIEELEEEQIEALKESGAVARLPTRARAAGRGR